MFKGVCFKASTLEANSDALPDDCKAYQPHEEWTEADWWSVARSQARGSGDGGSRWLAGGLKGKSCASMR